MSAAALLLLLDQHLSPSLGLAGLFDTDGFTLSVRLIHMRLDVLESGSDEQTRYDAAMPFAVVLAQYSLADAAFLGTRHLLGFLISRNPRMQALELSGGSMPEFSLGSW